MKDKPAIQTGSQFLVYQTEDGKLKIDVRFEGETVWLTQQQMAKLFQTSKQNVSLHIRNTFSEGELLEDSVVKESLTTAADGKNYTTKFYNLDVIISVGRTGSAKVAEKEKLIILYQEQAEVQLTFKKGEHHGNDSRNQWQ
jgi:hypothetical protein